MKRLRDILIVFVVLAGLLVALALSSRVRDGVYETFLSDVSIDTGSMTSNGKQAACMFAAGQVDDLCDGNVNIQKRMFFGDRNMSTEPSTPSPQFVMTSDTCASLNAYIDSLRHGVMQYN